MRQRGVKANNAREESSSTLEDQSDFPSEEIVKAPVVAQPTERWRTFRTRLLWTLAMIFAFFFIVAAGHFYCSCLVMVIMTLSYKEIIELKRKAHIENRLPLFYVQRWYWFILTLFGCLYMYLLPLTETITKSKSQGVVWIVQNHNMITYMGSVIGAIVFILSLRRYSIRYQFSQISLLLLTCLIVVGQGSAQIKNISSGLIWFFISCTSVIANDISAYLFGSAYGKTKLLPRISPQKTVEGFFGASVITFMWAFLCTEFLSWFSIMTCPNEDFTIVPFAMWQAPVCKAAREFTWTHVQSPECLAWFPGMPSHLIYRPVWGHAMVLAGFASFVAPFGGLLASAFKRAFKVKDFGASIPGHGGVTDRFDCQLLMGMFTYLYVRTFVGGRRTVSLLPRLTTLSDDDKWLVFEALADHLSKSEEGKRIIVQTLSHLPSSSINHQCT